MDREINKFEGHTVVCGWGRVGKAVAEDLVHAGHQIVVVDLDEERVANLPYPTIVGDATLDATLRSAGIGHANALIAALEGDAENLFVTLSARAIVPKLFIVARARQDESVSKLANAGADRVVNPQELGAARMASFVARPNVAEFIDVVMHGGALEYSLEEMVVPTKSPIDGLPLSEARIRDGSGGALILALRDAEGNFHSNPPPSTSLRAGTTLIVIGTADQHTALGEYLRTGAVRVGNVDATGVGE